MTQLPRVFKDAHWDEIRCLQEFRTALCDQDSNAAEACMRAMDRLGCWHAAFKQLITGPSSDVPGSSVLWFWISYGFHCSDSLQGDSILVEVMKALLPPYSGPGHMLYRGEDLKRFQRRAYGMSWTTDARVGRMFAQRRDPAGIVLKLDASPKMIICDPTAHSKYLGESEYLIDPSMIETIEIDRCV